MATLPRAARNYGAELPGPVQLPIPATAPLIGLALHGQALVLEPNGAALDLGSSNLVSITIGAR